MKTIPLEDVSFDEVNFENLQEWCEDFVHWNYVQDELADIGVSCKEIDESVKVAMLHIKMEIDKIKIGKNQNI